MTNAKKKHYDKSIETELKKKSIIFSVWDCEDRNNDAYNWYSLFRRLFKKSILFDFRAKKHKMGYENMKKLFFNILKNEKPSFVIFSPVIFGELELYDLKKIKLISPKTRTIVLFGDDDVGFETLSRYVALFFDYVLIAQLNYLKKYFKEKIKNVYTITGADLEKYKPLPLNKKYDVTFIGTVKSDRIDLLRFLIRNKIYVNIFGHGWYDYPEFRDNYKGVLSSEDYVKVINQSKIVLSFSKNHLGKPHFKGRIFEVGACKTFQLIDYFNEYSNLFKEGSEIIMFKNKNDLLKKIKYYLNNEDERERIANNCYKSIVKKFNSKKILLSFFKKILLEKNFHKDLPKLNKTVVSISREDLNDYKKLNEKTKKADYIEFITSEGKYLPYKSFLQAYSLDLLKKQISCCSYYVYSKKIGSYLAFNPEFVLINNNYKDFNKLLNINQLMVTKNFFFENLDKIKKAFDTGFIDFVKKKNSVIISIPLVRLEKFNKLSYDKMKNYFQMKFLSHLYSLIYQKRIFSDSYMYNLLIISLLNKNFFILKHIFYSAFKKENLIRLKF